MIGANGAWTEHHFNLQSTTTEGSESADFIRHKTISEKRTKIITEKGRTNLSTRQTQQERSREEGGFAPAYLGIIGGTSGEQRMKRVIAGNKETSKVDQKLASNVEEDEEEVDADQT